MILFVKLLNSGCVIVTNYLQFDSSHVEYLLPLSAYVLGSSVHDSMSTYYCIKIVIIYFHEIKVFHYIVLSLYVSSIS